MGALRGPGMQTRDGAMRLRTLQTIDGLGPRSSNTVVLFPVEWVSLLRALQQHGGESREGEAPAEPDQHT